MNSATQTILFRIVRHTFLFSSVIFGIHKYIQYHFFKEATLFHPIYAIYLFLMVSVLILFYFIIKEYEQNPEKIFVIYLVGSLLKSGAVVLFFLPLFFKEINYLNHTVFNFFIPYFLFLFYEIYLITNLSKEVK